MERKEEGRPVVVRHDKMDKEGGTSVEEERKVQGRGNG
jgi:hypothetical protein